MRGTGSGEAEAHHCQGDHDDQQGDIGDDAHEDAECDDAQLVRAEADAREARLVRPQDGAQRPHIDEHVEQEEAGIGEEQQPQIGEEIGRDDRRSVAGRGRGHHADERLDKEREPGHRDKVEQAPDRQPPGRCRMTENAPPMMSPMPSMSSPLSAA